MIDRVIGVDFSGAKDAGKRIWIAEASIYGGKICVTRCQPASKLLGSSVARDKCLAALAAYIAVQRNVIVGCDFPFGLPSYLLDNSNWSNFVLDFVYRFKSPEEFQVHCTNATLQETNGRYKEMKRDTDGVALTPWAAWNLKLFRQTYHGIRDFLAPLVRAGAAHVLPMDRPSLGRPWIVETCPASTLKSVSLYPSYKGAGEQPKNARQAIVDGLIGRGMMPRLSIDIHRVAIDNKGGDALDSLIAACATVRCLLTGQFEERVDKTSRLEGRVYF